MTRISSCARISLVFLTISCSSSKNATSDEKAYPSRRLTPVIDAKAAEWGDQLSYNNTTKTIYSIANDDNNLYVLVKALDRTQQMKIIQGGMEIWLDPKMKSKKTIGIKYPLGGAKMEMPSGNRSGPPDPKQMRQLARQQLVTMELMGFKEELNGSQNAYMNAQVKPSLDWDDKDNLIYELSISLKALPDDIVSHLSNISVGFFIKGLQMPEGFSGTPGGMRGEPPGGGRRPSGPPLGGQNMGDRSQMETMSKDASFWTKYSIGK